MPLNIDIAFKWGQKKKEEPPKPTTTTTTTTNTNTGTKNESSEEDSSTCSSCSSSSESSTSLTLESVTALSDVVTNPTQFSESLQSTQREEISTAHGRPLSNKRLIVVVRHAERMDRVFPSWLTLANSNGDYRPYDANQPRRLPQRHGGLSLFVNDPPLTRLGQSVAVLRGKSMDYVHFVPAAIYSSPALRCIETAHLIAQALSMKADIRIEPGLFDWTGWYMDGVPVWMTISELVAAGYNVDRNYKPIQTAESVMRLREENKHELYRRIQSVITQINKKVRGNVLIVGHATTLDAGVRSLLGLQNSVPKFKELDKLGDRYAYCSSVVLEQTHDREHFKIGKSLNPITTNGYSTTIDNDFLLRP
ncbi:hypothetical protein M3Y94_00116200 [Aphelenchoides besseyi]|nr:hypothetical protein M3Y94_00116200 [Aphelenchoides besseyi]KAI6237456.1 hypothetical protein M3Y95_00266900 [Aphelenchoides besseyi]